MKVCPSHSIHVPLLFTFKFPGAEYWCPVCGANWGVLGAGVKVPFTNALEARHEFLTLQCSAYLSSTDEKRPVITEEKILDFEAQESNDDKPQIKCDGCSTKANARIGPRGEVLKPSSWYQREDIDGVQIACSRACVSVIAKASGKTNMVMPW